MTTRFGKCNLNAPEHLNQRCGVTTNATPFTHLLCADDLVLVSETANGMQELIDIWSIRQEMAFNS